MWESVLGAKSQARHPTHIVCPRFCHGIHPANGRKRNQRDKKKLDGKSSMERNETEGRNIPVMGVQQETSGL
ncbi:hypothetical protein TNCV_441281 [Trichonephila clavipes]|nr:hypothetical protein TNCV_441281 [Trichonephila clavipes]